MRSTLVLSCAAAAVLAGVASACGGSGNTPVDAGIGSPCELTGDCNAGLSCVRSSVPPILLPGGYCSRSCDDGRRCASDNDCFPKAIGGGGCDAFTQTCNDCGVGSSCMGGMCMGTCSASIDCKRNDGYECVTAYGVCAATINTVGKPCAKDLDCGTGSGLTCVTSVTYPSPPTDNAGKDLPVQPFTNPFSKGYCTKKCGSAADCPLSEGGVCASPVGGVDQYCMMACTSDDYCKAAGQSSCRTVAVTRNPRGVFSVVSACTGNENIGAKCTVDTDCTASVTDDTKKTPITPTCVDGTKTGFVDKFCTVTCKADLDCPYDSLCTTSGYCARKCYLNSNCTSAMKTVCNYKGYTKDPYPWDALYLCSGTNNFGTACADDTACTTGLKCQKGAGYAGGMCTLACTKEADCAKVGAKWCLDGACQRDCTDTTGEGQDMLCNRAFQTCRTPAGKGPVCTSRADRGNVGGGCRRNADCSPGLMCITGNGWTDGYCTARCVNDSDCGDTTLAYCKDGRYCGRLCTTYTGRYGYLCQEDPGDIMNPKRSIAATVPNLGGACTTVSTEAINLDCQALLDCYNTGPASLCTRACSKDAECLGYGLCDSAATKLCWKKCTADADCDNSLLVCNKTAGRCALK
ncbi:MAG: hypothetical protein WC889_18740 [Myxococcota bacterium]|jgi:hypothetical protein